MKVYLAQLKCENNHCVLAAAEVYSDRDDAEQLSYTLGHEAGRLNATDCGLCGSTTLHIDIRETPWESLKEARPHLMAAQLEQMKSRALARLFKHHRN